MSAVSEKVAYLKGLAEGMNIDSATNEGKLLNEIIKVLGMIAEDIEYLEDTQDEISDNLCDLEDFVYEDEEWEDWEDDDDMFDDYEDDDETFGCACDNCGEEFFISTDDLESDEPLFCPYCGTEVELSFDCDMDCEGCSGCGDE